MNLRPTIALLLLSLVPGTALAGGAVILPEPGVLELLAIGAIAGVAIVIRNRRK